MRRILFRGSVCKGVTASQWEAQWRCRRIRTRFKNLRLQGECDPVAPALVGPQEFSTALPLHLEQSGRDLGSEIILLLRYCCWLLPRICHSAIMLHAATRRVVQMLMLTQLMALTTVAPSQAGQHACEGPARLPCSPCRCPAHPVAALLILSLPCSSCRCLTRLHLCGREKKKTLVMIQTSMTWSKTIPCRKLLCRLMASRQQPCRCSPEGPVKPLSRPPQPGSPRPRTSSSKPRLR